MHPLRVQAIYECCLDEGSFNEIFAKYSGKQNAERVSTARCISQQRDLVTDAVLSFII